MPESDKYRDMTPEQAAAFMANAQKQPARKRLAEMVGHGTVIDIGCGKGEEVSDLFTREQYVGIDPSLELIKLAREKNPGFTFIAMSGTEIPLEPLFDFAIIKSTLEHLPENEAVAVLHHARRIARTVLVCWHMEPSVTRAKKGEYEGEIGRMIQTRHRREAFPTLQAREKVDPHVIWTVRGA